MMRISFRFMTTEFFSTQQNRCTNLWYMLENKIVQYQSKNMNSLITKHCLYNNLPDYKTCVCNKIIPAKSSSGDTMVIASFKIYDSRIGFIYEPRHWRLRDIIVVLSIFYFSSAYPHNDHWLKTNKTVYENTVAYFYFCTRSEFIRIISWRELEH